METKKQRLINADEYFEIIRDDLEIHGKCFRLAVDHLNSMPTVDAVEVVHGHWNRLHFVTEIACPDKYICSECRSIFYKEFNYCPDCGAYMKGDKNGD